MLIFFVKREYIVNYVDVIGRWVGRLSVVWKRFEFFFV